MRMVPHVDEWCTAQERAGTARDQLARARAASVAMWDDIRDHGRQPTPAVLFRLRSLWRRAHVAQAWAEQADTPLWRPCLHPPSD